MHGRCKIPLSLLGRSPGHTRLTSPRRSPTSTILVCPQYSEVQYANSNLRRARECSRHRERTRNPSIRTLRHNVKTKRQKWLRLLVESVTPFQLFFSACKCSASAIATGNLYASTAAAPRHIDGNPRMIRIYGRGGRTLLRTKLMPLNGNSFM